MQETVLDSIVTGVYVLTAHHRGQMNGSTVAWVTPVSYDPLLVMVSLASLRVSHDLVKQSGYFGINVLGADQKELAHHFGFKTARDQDKLEGISFSASDHGIPILNDAHAFIECRVVDVFPAGEHSMFVGEVVSAEILNEDQTPLVFKQEDFF